MSESVVVRAIAQCGQQRRDGVGVRMLSQCVGCGDPHVRVVPGQEAPHGGGQGGAMLVEGAH